MAMSPPFDLQGGLSLALVRAGWVACLLSVTGSLMFQMAVMPRVGTVLSKPEAERISRRLHVWTRASIAAGLAFGLAWLLLQSWVMAGAASLHQLAAAVPMVAAHTRFGHLVLLQWVALGLAGCAGRASAGRWAGSGFALCALALQAGHSHAAAMAAGPTLLLAADVVHLASAAAWLGGLMPLLLVVQAGPPKAGAAAAWGFSRVGKIGVAALAGSAVIQAWTLVGSLPAITDTAYGWMILVKLALFAVLLGFAYANRYRFAPALIASPAPARAALIRSIAVQSCCGVAVVAAAAVLSALPPAMHMGGG